MALSPDLEHRLASQIRSTRSARRKDVIRVMVLFAVMGGLVAAFAEPPLSNMWVMCAIAVALPAVWLLFSTREHPGLRRLRTAGLGDAVWIYVTRGTGTQFQLVHLVVHYADRTVAKVPVELGAEEDLLHLVGREAPQATVGFTPERERAFLQDPSRLRS